MGKNESEMTKESICDDFRWQTTWDQCGRSYFRLDHALSRCGLYLHVHSDVIGQTRMRRGNADSIKLLRYLWNILHCTWFNSFLTSLSLSLSVCSWLTCLSFVSMYRFSSRWCLRLVFLVSFPFSDFSKFPGLITLVDCRKILIIVHPFFLLLSRFRNKQIEVSLWRSSGQIIYSNAIYFVFEKRRQWKGRENTHTNSFARSDTTIVHECRILSVCR